jgi:hypothetical protein
VAVPEADGLTNVNCGWVGVGFEPPGAHECHFEGAYRP